MKRFKLIILIIFMSFLSALHAQSTFMLWGYSDHPKRTDSFTFVVRSDGMVNGIVLTAGFSIESFRRSANNNLVFNSDKVENQTIEIASDFKSAVLSFPNGTRILYRLAEPPYALIQYFQNNANTNTTTGGNGIVQNKCSLCHGKGWIAGTSTPTYGSGGTYYCSECGRNVPASHSHDRCPSCNGKGYIEKIR